MSRNYPHKLADGSYEIDNRGNLLKNVHPESACQGRHCVIHSPSDHHMRDWLLNWRQHDGFANIKESHFERICPCGVGHPDPDDLYYHLTQGRDYMAVHGCCGCCEGGYAYPMDI